MMAEPWEPTLEQVATRIPTRTRDATTPGDDAMLVTFNAQTTPTEEQANRFIALAVVEVLSAAGTVPAAPARLGQMAGDAAAWRAAADIELAYPQRDGDTSLYELLDARAKDATARLVAAVDDAGSGPEGSLLPVWSFPAPGWPGDYPI